MTLTRFTALAAVWWPAPIAAVVFLSVAFTYGVNDTWAMPGTLVSCGALAIARWRPTWAILAAGCGTAATALLAPPWSGGYVGIMLLAASAAALAVYELEPMRWRLYAAWFIGGVAVAAGILRAVIDASATYGMSYGAPFASSGSLFIILPFVIVGALTWAIPFGLRAFRDALRAEQEKTAVQAHTVVVESELRDERLRADLTHDFHDVMAHSLAVLAAQAEGLRLTHRDHPERIEPVLTTISDTARLALVEVRQLLERVDDDDTRRPQPTIEDIPALIDQTRSAGPQVTYHDAGRHGALPRIGGIAAYRIVQEALTNALRHGGTDAEIVVTLSWTGPGLALAISSPIRDRASLGPIGRGIAGMHERAKQAGGWVDIDAEGERFVVTAYLPYDPEPQASTVLGEDQLPTVPVHVVRPQGWTAGMETPTGPMRPSAPPTTPTPAATWGEANARRVQLGEPDPDRPA